MGELLHHAWLTWGWTETDLDVDPIHFSVVAAAAPVMFLVAFERLERQLVAVGFFLESPQCWVALGSDTRREAVLAHGSQHACDARMEVVTGRGR